MNKLIVALLLISCFALPADAQVSLNSVVQKYNSFKSTFPGVRLHFVFNQDKYAAGDTVFFKGYFFKDDLQPVPDRQLIDISLIAADGKVVRYFLFATNNGTGANQLILPETLTPGFYTFAAYSSWMKNISTPPIFTRELLVVGDRSIQETKSPVKTDVNVSLNADGNQVNIYSVDGSATRYQQLYLLITNKSKIVFSRSFTQGVRDRTMIGLSGITLPAGMNVMHVIDKIGRPVGHASHYVPEPNDVTAVIESAQPQLQTRKKATLTIKLLDKNNIPVQGEFSVKVLNASVFDSVQNSFAHELALSAPASESWRQIIYGRSKTPKFGYTTDLSKRGRAYYPDGTPMPAQTRLFFYMHENDVMIQSMTSEGGKVKLSIPDIYGDDNLFYMAEIAGKEIPGVTIVWANDPLQLPSPPMSKEIDEPDTYGIFTANKRMIDMAFDFDEAPGANRNMDVPRNESELENRLKGADITVQIDDYVSFGTMEELIREVVPALKVRKVRGQYVAQIGLQQGIPESEPLFIIDGIATKDTQFFLSLKPVDIETIKLMTNPGKLATLGLMGRSGIVIVETKVGNSHPPVDNSRFVKGVNRPITFKQSSHGNIRRPDFRSTIYWDPIVKTDSNGRGIVEFECSDDLGPVYIRVDGLTSDGRPFSGDRKLTFVLTE